MREFFATAPRGMEPLLAQELQAMFAEEVACKRAGGSFCGSMEGAYRACLWSRIANRILLPLSAFLALKNAANNANLKSPAIPENILMCMNKNK